MKLTDALRLADQMELPDLRGEFYEPLITEWGGDKPPCCAIGGANIAARNVTLAPAAHNPDLAAAKSALRDGAADITALLAEKLPEGITLHRMATTYPRVHENILRDEIKRLERLLEAAQEALLRWRNRYNPAPWTCICLGDITNDVIEHKPGCATKAALEAAS